MIAPSLTRAIAFSVPVVCTTVVLLLTLLDTKRSGRLAVRKRHYRMLLACGVHILFWTGMILYSLTGGLDRLGLAWTILVLPCCLPFLRHGYRVLIEPDDIASASAGKIASANRLGRERMEGYLTGKKPWLDPEFKITDMAQDLFSNRAYISAFINKEYGMNFNRLINRYRLHEVERLRVEAAQKRHHASSLQIVLNAGFNNYRSYLRAKKREEAEV